MSRLHQGQRPTCPHCRGSGRVLDVASRTRLRCDYCFGRAVVSDGDAETYVAVRDGMAPDGGVFDSHARPASEVA